MVGIKVLCRQTWCWRKNRKFYILQATGSDLSHWVWLEHIWDLKAHLQSDTLLPTRSHLLRESPHLEAICFQTTAPCLRQKQTSTLTIKWISLKLSFMTNISDLFTYLYVGEVNLVWVDVAQGDLEFVVCLKMTLNDQTHRCWDWKYAPPCLVYEVLWILPRVSCMPGKHLINSAASPVGSVIFVTGSPLYPGQPGTHYPLSLRGARFKGMRLHTHPLGLC